MYIYVYYYLDAGFNPFEEYLSNWIIFLSGGENSEKVWVATTDPFIHSKAWELSMHWLSTHSAVLDPEKKSLNGLFSLLNICNPKKFKPFSHWPSKKNL